MTNPTIPYIGMHITGIVSPPHKEWLEACNVARHWWTLPRVSFHLCEANRLFKVWYLQVLNALCLLDKYHRESNYVHLCLQYMLQVNWLLVIYVRCDKTRLRHSLALKTAFYNCPTGLYHMLLSLVTTTFCVVQLDTSSATLLVREREGAYRSSGVLLLYLPMPIEKWVYLSLSLSPTPLLPTEYNLIQDTGIYRGGWKRA